MEFIIKYPQHKRLFLLVRPFYMEVLQATWFKPHQHEGKILSLGTMEIKKKLLKKSPK